MLIEGSPPNLMTRQEVEQAFGRSRQALIQAGVLDFLKHWKVGTVRLYDSQDVADFRYWLLIRDGLIALDGKGQSSPLLPPGKTPAEKRAYFDAFINDDNFGVACPRCGGKAVRPPEGGQIWCSKCGL